jgi:flavin reductase (DIM6/NTAB) family NADH-FMN oxidoreductase RutF
MGHESLFYLVSTMFFHEKRDWPRKSYNFLHRGPIVLMCARGKEGCFWVTPVSDDPPLIAMSL